MALGRDKIPKEVINTDIYYTLYLNISRHINQLDLYQVSQLAMFMSQPDVSPYVPDELWTQTLQSALIDGVENYKKYGEKINKEVYIDDMLRTMVSFAMRQTGTKSFLKKMEEFF